LRADIDALLFDFGDLLACLERVIFRKFLKCTKYIYSHSVL